VFDQASRYYNLTTKTETLADGSTISYISRRFLPVLTNQPVLAKVRLTDNDRLDLLAAQYIANPLLAWQICDANNLMNPLTALEVGAVLTITMPLGG